MLTGYSSHQIGLDVDIWFTPIPDHELSQEEREFNSALNVVAEDRLDVDPKVWTHAHPEVVRVRGGGPGRLTYLRERGDQEGDVPRGGTASRLAVEGAAVVAT